MRDVRPGRAARRRAAGRATTSRTASRRWRRAFRRASSSPRRAEALETFPGVPGRMEIIDEGQPFRVVVDIASTEQAMRNVLRMLRPITPGKLIVVFGAAGERDPARRRRSRARSRSARTTRSSRTKIRAGRTRMRSSTRSRASVEGGRVPRVRARAGPARGDRARVRAREPGDTVLLAGKGTEQSIVIGTRTSRGTSGASRASCCGKGGRPVAVGRMCVWMMRRRIRRHCVLRE